MNLSPRIIITKFQMKKLIKLKIGLITYDFYKVINELKASNNNNKNLGNIFCNKICYFVLNYVC